ncbi:MAG TPA: protein kinase [Gemmataceae bacterium]|jgi:serine/threonine protein kinase|nr:protein kinase [Gemmataceae bacterium]
MDTPDPTTFGQLVVKLQLVSPEQVEEAMNEARDETGGRMPDLQRYLRVLERKGYLTPWQSGKVLKGDTDGFVLGGFRILYKIASGSFGRVFRAVDPRGGRVVAVKVLRRRWSEDQQRIDLFIREGRVGLTLKHPNIVEVLAMSQDKESGQYYIVMEFVEGGNLREILVIRKTLTPSEALRIVEDCASGLAYAYSRGVSHRDIKLTNLLISSAGECKLVDFGLAQFFAAIAKEEEKVDRTVDYAGLERATNVKQGDVRSDIYFLGCALYEMLCGHSPLVMTRDRHMRMRRQRFEEVQTLNPAEVAAPASVFALVETMMSLSPQRRFQTPSQLVEAVRACRRELSGKDESRQASRSVFVAERDERLQDALRDKLKELGYRVFLAGDPSRALDRYRQQPYDALIVDAGTTGEDGLHVYDQVLTEAGRRRATLAGILILGKDQADWVKRAVVSPTGSVMVRPVTLKQVYRKLAELLPDEGDNGAGPRNEQSA